MTERFTQGDRIRGIKEQREANFGWSSDQRVAFDDLVENRPELAKRVFDSSQVLSRSSEYPIKMVRGHWRTLKSLGFLPTPSPKPRGNP